MSSASIKLYNQQSFLCINKWIRRLHGRYHRHPSLVMPPPGEASSSSTPPPTKKTKENPSAFIRDIFAERNLAMSSPANTSPSPALIILRWGFENHAKEVKLKVWGKMITLNRKLIETVLELPTVSDGDEDSFFSFH